MAWGPVPALIVWGFQEILHRWVGDLQLTFGFLCGVFLVQYLLLSKIWDRYFQNLPRWLLWVSILFAGLAGPSTYMLNNYNAGRIYDAAVLGGQFFLLSGFFTAVIALQKWPSRWAAASTGVFWALAIGTRPDLAPAVGVMVLAVSVWALKIDGWSLNTIRRLLYMYSPLLLGCALVGWYNWARFGSVLETGYFYQMAGVNLHKHWNERFSFSYVIPNFYNYVLNPVLITSKFPFFQIQNGNSEAISGFGAIPDFYHAQMLTGIIWNAPFVVFALAALRRVVTGMLISRRDPPSVKSEGEHLLSWIELTLTLSCLITFAVVLCYFWAAMRFLENLLPSLIVLSVLGFWHGYERLSEKGIWSRLYCCLGIALVSASVAISTLGTISVLTLRFQIADLFPLFR